MFTITVRRFNGTPLTSRTFDGTRDDLRTLIDALATGYGMRPLTIDVDGIDLGPAYAAADNFDELVA